MIKEVLQQLEPLDAQIDALCSRADDAEMASTTTHAAELAELSAEENTASSAAWVVVRLNWLSFPQRKTRFYSAAPR